MKKKALVAGALGVTGRSLIHHLDTLKEWEVVGISRRSPDFATQAKFISLDLLDRQNCEKHIDAFSDISHLLFTAYIPARSTLEELNANLTMLKNIVEVVEKASSRLQRVVLVEGIKYYGAHLGPFKTPAKETDPRHMPPNFYYDQEDFLKEQSANKQWGWSALRPSSICGLAIGNPMNLLNAIAVYASISKELGLPLRFPGKSTTYNRLVEATDAGLLAKAIVWAATSENAFNEAFNITNGDFFRWEFLWPKFAEYFKMDLAYPQTIRLADIMSDKDTIWNSMVKKHALRPYSYEEVVQWGFADVVFNIEYDLMSDTTKARKRGFYECVESDEMFLRLFDQLRKERWIP
jgi:nucleoside-diphosphate-sugar epimerase